MVAPMAQIRLFWMGLSCGSDSFVVPMTIYDLWSKQFFFLNWPISFQEWMTGELFMQWWSQIRDIFKLGNKSKGDDFWRKFQPGNIDPRTNQVAPTGAMAGEVTVPCVTDRGASDRICGYRTRTDVFYSGDNSGLNDWINLLKGILKRRPLSIAYFHIISLRRSHFWGRFLDSVIYSWPIFDKCICTFLFPSFNPALSLSHVFQTLK